MISRRRLKQWVEALRLAGVRRVPWLGLVRAILSGPVPREVWRVRMRTCYECPLFSTVQMPGTTKRTDRLWLCKSTHPDMVGIGCGCALHYKALAAEPYQNGCFGRGLDPDLGWPAYRFRDWGERLGCVIDFIMHPPDKLARTIQPQGRPGQI